MSENYFSELYAVNVSEKIEKKNNLSYLSWAWAWAELKKRHPDAISTVYENKEGWIYHTDGKTAWVKTGVTVNGIEHIEYLPIMNYQNKSIPLDSITSYDVNKSIQRSMTKAIGRHGIGLSIYAGEDLPEEAKEDIKLAQQNDIAEKEKAFIAEFEDLQKELNKYLNTKGIFEHPENVRAVIAAKDVKNMRIALSHAKANEKMLAEKVKQTAPAIPENIF